jgi:hypothetical protein
MASRREAKAKASLTCTYSVIDERQHSVYGAHQKWWLQNLKLWRDESGGKACRLEVGEVKIENTWRMIWELTNHIIQGLQSNLWVPVILVIHGAHKVYHLNKRLSKTSCANAVC